MALRLLARTAARHLRRGVPPRPAPARIPQPPLPAGLGRHGRPPGAGWSSLSIPSPAPQARVSKVGAFAFLAARAAQPRPQGLKLLKAFGMTTTLAMTLYAQKAACAEEVRPADPLFEDSKGPLGLSKHERLRLWSLVRKYNLPVDLLVLIGLGWQNPLGLAIHILLLLYSSRPNTYSIYLFLEEIRQSEIQKNPALWREKDAYDALMREKHGDQCDPRAMGPDTAVIYDGFGGMAHGRPAFWTLCCLATSSGSCHGSVERWAPLRPKHSYKLSSS